MKTKERYVWLTFASSIARRSPEQQAALTGATRLSED